MSSGDFSGWTGAGAAKAGLYFVSDPSSAARAYVEKELVVKLEYW
jgi:hypothetical protein